VTTTVAVKIRLKRLGKIRAPHYRIVVADSRTKRDGRAIEEIGLYQPTQEPSLIEVDSERAQYWLGVGAQPTEQVLALLKITGDWQKYKGLPGQEGTLRVAEAKADKKAVFEAAAREDGNEPKSGATTPRARKAAKSAEPAAAAEAPAEVVATEPAAEAVATEAPAEAPAEAVATEAPADAAATESTPAADPADAAGDTPAEA
jgi:small subunit ribosomal protein S16